MPRVQLAASADSAMDVVLQNVNKRHRGRLFSSPNPSYVVGKPRGRLTVRSSYRAKNYNDKTVRGLPQRSTTDVRWGQVLRYYASDHKHM